MRALVLLFILCSLSASYQHVSASDIAPLFRKFMLRVNELSKQDSPSFKDVLEKFLQPESKQTLDTSPRMSLECLVCRSAFTALSEVIKNGLSDEDAAEAISTICITLGIESESVCKGAVGLNIPIIAYIMRNEPKALPSTFCGLFFQRADGPHICPINDERFNWEVELPERSVVPTPQLNTQPLKVALITDAHIDPLYEAFGVAECDAPVCCRVGQTPRISPRSPYFVQSPEGGEFEFSLDAAKLSIQKEIPHRAGRNAAPAGYWGDYRDCDTPLWAYDDAIENIHENHQDVDVVYYVGDTIDHGVWETSYELINDMNRYLVEKIRRTFGDRVLVVPALGNHEAQPTNQFAPASIVVEKLNTTWLYKALVEKWGYYLPDEAKQSLLEQGDFSVVVRPGLRVISLNNNVAYRDNWWLAYDPVDAKRHLDWLVRELHRAEQAGERVHILAHIPPGVADLTLTWSREYGKIVNRFSATIAAEFNGHTHSDEFKLFYSPEGTPSNVAWGAGSVTAFSFYNLNYKIITFNQNFAPERILNYAYNLTEANLTPQRRPHWFLLYDMQNSFALPDLSPQSIHNLIYSMVTGNRLGLDLYTAFISKISDERWPWCRSNAECQISNLCRTVITVLWERDRCEELRRLFYS